MFAVGPFFALGIYPALSILVSLRQNGVGPNKTCADAILPKGHYWTDAGDRRDIGTRRSRKWCYDAAISRADCSNVCTGWYRYHEAGKVFKREGKVGDERAAVAEGQKERQAAERSRLHLAQGRRRFPASQDGLRVGRCRYHEAQAAIRGAPLKAGIPGDEAPASGRGIGAC